MRTPAAQWPTEQERAETRIDSLQRQLDDKSVRIGRLDDDVRRLTKAVESRDEHLAQYQYVGQLIALNDGMGTVFADWNELRFQLPAGTRLFAVTQASDAGDANG